MSFSLIMPRLDLGTDERYELCPGYTLRRATSQEIDQIREYVGDSRCFGELIRAYFEGEIVRQGSQRLLQIQPKEAWKYCVVQFDGSGENLDKFGYALDFLYFAPVLALTLFDSGGSSLNSRFLGHGLMQCLLTLDPDSSSNAIKFPSNFIPVIRSIYNSLVPLAKNDARLAPFRRFHLLKHLPLDSDARVLGLFSVIEMILTHKPEQNLHDSLRHQVSIKMELLSRRFIKNDLYALFPNRGRTELWKALYDWRSLIAHGGDIDFSKGSLQKLESEAKARLFLDMSTRFLLKTFLDEYELVSDLKRC